MESLGARYPSVSDPGQVVGPKLGAPPILPASVLVRADGSVVDIPLQVLRTPEQVRAAVDAARGPVPGDGRLGLRGRRPRLAAPRSWRRAGASGPRTCRSGGASPDGAERAQRRGAHAVREAPGTRPDLLLTERAAELRAHAGQAAFPGGTIDPTDAGPVAAALREAHEETGLDPDGVVPLVTLPPADDPGHRVRRDPVLAHWARPVPVRVVDPRRDRRRGPRPGRRAHRSGARGSS